MVFEVRGLAERQPTVIPGRLFEDCCRVDATCDEPPILDGVIIQTDDGLVMEARNLSVDA